MTDKYRIDPNFSVPEPTGADMFGFCELEQFDEVERLRQCDWMRVAGAKQMRATVVSDEFPNPPYPNGYYFEGWKDATARQLPFGEAGPPLTALKARHTQAERKGND